MDIADVTTDLGPGFQWAFAKETERMVDVPESPNGRMIDGFEQGAQAAGLGVDAVGFDQERHLAESGVVGQ